jgi:protein SCO1
MARKSFVVACRFAGRLVRMAAAPALCSAWIMFAATPVLAESGVAMADHEHHHHDHGAMGMATTAKRSEVQYSIPALTLVRQDGQKVSFPAELEDGRPVILNFVYTSCTAICPVTTQVFGQVRDKLGAESAKLHMVSISIDPEYDTPARLDEFSRKFNADRNWQFYTGTPEASVAIQKALDAYRGDKMNHIPVTYLRAAPGKPWVRLDGLRSPDEIVKEYRGLIGKG